jgi:hypothetical protein
MPIVGLILAVVFQSHMFLYGMLAVGGFLLFKIMTAFFDFRTAYSVLSGNLLIFLEREVGQFYTADTGGALLRLRSDLVEAITRQTAGLQETIGKLSDTQKSVAEQLAVLTEVTAAFTVEQKAFVTQAELIERNQQILEKTYQSYELTLPNLTQQLGDGLGTYLNMHAQTASQAVNDTMTANINKIAQLIELGNKQNA